MYVQIWDLVHKQSNSGNIWYFYLSPIPMIYLHKILPTFVLPIMLVIIVILIGLIYNKKKLIYIAIGVLYILSTPIFSNNFFKLVEGSGHNDYRKPISAIDSADAIVVLSGPRPTFIINH